MSIPLPNIPDTGKVRDGYVNFNNDRAMINRIYIQTNDPGLPPAGTWRVWIRPAAT